MQNRLDNGLALQILRVIQEHTASGPITGKALALRFQTDLRSITTCIEHLRNLGFRIGASKGKRLGYFHARTIEEILPTIEQRRSQALKILIGNKKMLESKEGQSTIWDEMAERDLQTIQS